MPRRLRAVETATAGQEFIELKVLDGVLPRVLDQACAIKMERCSTPAADKHVDTATSRTFLDVLIDLVDIHLTIFGATPASRRGA